LSEETPKGDNSVSVGAQRAVPLQSRLEAYLQRGGDKAFHVSNLTPISDGWETEVYAFTLTRRRRKSSEMILRMYPGANAAETCKREFLAMRGIQLLNYPVPYVTDREKDSEWLGKPFIIMQKIDGRPLGDLMREDVPRQPELLSRFVQLAVELHHLNPALFLQMETFSNLPADPSAWLPALLLRWRGIVAAHTWAAPIFDWLDAHAPEVASGTTRLSPLHGDFHPHNVLITPADQLYVIDWSGFSLGDYRYDLAWTLLLIASSGYPQLRDLILSEYARLAGQPVENIEYFDVLAALRRLYDLAASLGSGAESLGMRPETVAIMRQQQPAYQYVYTLLRDRTGIRVPYLEDLIANLSG
jgi:aminoglycoside phosphotransferase (APT) family kinase protein